MDLRKMAKISENCKSCVHAQRDGCDDNTPNCAGYLPEAWVT